MIAAVFIDKTYKQKTKSTEKKHTPMGIASPEHFDDNIKNSTQSKQYKMFYHNNPPLGVLYTDV
jgi:hypothetical protein